MSTYPGEDPADEGEPTAPITPRRPPYPQQPQVPPQAPRPTTPYPQPSYQGYPPSSPAGWVPQPGYYPPRPTYGPWSPPAPDHPQATTAMILGILGLALGFACCLGFLASPFAWALGRSALRDIEVGQGRYRGEAAARTGMYTGIAGTVILAGELVLLVIVALIAIVTPSGSGSSI